MTNVVFWTLGLGAFHMILEHIDNPNCKFPSKEEVLLEMVTQVKQSLTEKANLEIEEIKKLVTGTSFPTEEAIAIIEKARDSAIVVAEESLFPSGLSTPDPKSVSGIVDQMMNE